MELEKNFISIGMRRSLEEVVYLRDVRGKLMDDNFVEFERNSTKRLKRSDFISSNVEEVVVEYPNIGDGAARQTWCLWKIEVNDPKIMQKNVMQLPHTVLKNRDLIGKSSIELVDSATDDTCLCDLHANVKEDCVEKFICHGWYELAKDMRLEKGDVLGFSIKYPPVRSMTVTRLNR